MREELAVTVLVQLLRNAGWNETDLLLIRVGTIGGLVLLQRRGSAIVEEIDLDTRLSATVARRQRAIEILHQVDRSAVVRRIRSQDPWYGCRARIRVVANHGSVDQEGQEGMLRGRIAGTENSFGIIITDGDIGRTVGWAGEFPKVVRASEAGEDVFVVLHFGRSQSL